MFRSDLDEDDAEQNAVQREDGSWLLAGYMQADEMADILDIPLPDKRDYETVAGYVLSHLNHIPTTGEKFEAQGWRFEVVDLDGRRIDKVIASRRRLMTPYPPLEAGGSTPSVGWGDRQASAARLDLRRLCLLAVRLPGILQRDRSTMRVGPA